jgi:hypothetical protein
MQDLLTATAVAALTHDLARSALPHAPVFSTGRAAPLRIRRLSSFMIGRRTQPHAGNRTYGLKRGMGKRARNSTAPQA